MVCVLIDGPTASYGTLLHPTSDCETVGGDALMLFWTLMQRLDQPQSLHCRLSISTSTHLRKYVIN